MTAAILVAGYFWIGRPAPESSNAEVDALSRRVGELEAEIKILRSLYEQQRFENQRLSSGLSEFSAASPDPLPTEAAQYEALEAQSEAITNESSGREVRRPKARSSAESVPSELAAEVVDAQIDAETGEVNLLLSSKPEELKNVQVYLDVGGNRIGPATVADDRAGGMLFTVPPEQLAVEPNIRVNIETRLPDGQVMGRSIPFKETLKAIPYGGDE